jgi:hypothetical protein
MKPKIKCYDWQFDFWYLMYLINPKYCTACVAREHLFIDTHNISSLFMQGPAIASHFWFEDIEFEVIESILE